MSHLRLFLQHCLLALWFPQLQQTMRISNLHQYLTHFYHSTKNRQASALYRKIAATTKRQLFNTFSDRQKLYFQALQASNTKLKKPNQSLIKIETEAIQEMMVPLSKNKGSLKMITQFLSMIKHLKLMKIQSLDCIEEWAFELLRTQALNKGEIMSVIEFLVEQNRYKIWDQFHTINLSQLSNIQKIKYLYCQSIVNRQIPSLSQYHTILHQLPLPLQQAKLLKLAALESQQQPIQLVLQSQYQARSNLQLQIQTILRTIGLQYQRQVRFFNNFYIDFLVQSQSLTNDTHKILEVMGSHHYTVDNMLKGKDIMRCLILNKKHPVVIVHESDFNSLKGVSKKVQYVSAKLRNPITNWEKD